jgi:hypothetical protein
MQLIKAANQTNRLSTKNFFALHKRSPSRAAFASNKIQFHRRISFKEFGMLAREADRSVFRTGREFARAGALAVEASQSVNAAASC